MVYIRPSAPVVAPTAVKPVADSHRESGEHSLAGDAVINEYMINPQQDRRKQDRRKQDRRQQRKNALLETRAGRDRRKNSKTSISITV